jgi:hypothetical protein
VLSFVGFLFTLACAITGAYVWLRWGLCGARMIWRYREVIDAAVRTEINEIVIHDGGR